MCFMFDAAHPHLNTSDRTVLHDRYQERWERRGAQDHVNSTRLVIVNWAESILCATTVGDAQ
jgi:hypothetical protein